MNKLIFIIGMRRSGTSILRTLIMQHPEVQNIESEPNELFEITERINISRYKNIPYFKDTINKFKNHSKYYGAKLAINPGIEGMRWLNLEKTFPNAKFIFIDRDPKNTYKSWINNETSLRGTCSYEMYFPWWQHINYSFHTFTLQNPHKAIKVHYKNLLENPDKEMKKIWKLLGINEEIKGLDTLIRVPKFGDC